MSYNNCCWVNMQKELTAIYIVLLKDLEIVLKVSDYLTKLII